MSKIYECVKEKAKQENRIFYTQDSWYGRLPYSSFTYRELYHKINKTIKFLKYKKITNKPCFLVVNSVFEDIVTFIAMLEVGVKPIIVNSDTLYDLYEEKNYHDLIPFPYEILPSVRFDKNNHVSSLSMFILDKMPLDDKGKLANKEEIGDVLYNNFNIDEINIKEDYDFAILTSGTTGKGKIFPIKEEDIINKIKNQYDLEKEETFVSQNPISAISGLLFSLYIPIVGNNKQVYVGNLIFTPREKINNHLNIIVPSNYLSNYGTRNKNMALLADNDGSLTKKIDQITLLGDKTSQNVIKLVHHSLKRLPKSKVFIYYGRTENLGLISKINEQDIKPIYLYHSVINPQKIVYSYDKKEVFETSYINNTLINKKSDIKYNNNQFCEVLPIAIANTPNENIHVNGPIFGEIIADGFATKDYGLIFDNKIYYLCRKDELITLDNDNYYFVSALEEGFFPMLLSNPTHPNQRCVCVKENEKINIYIPCDVNEYKCDNYRNYHAELNNFFTKVKDFNNIGNIHLINSNDVKYGAEIGKLKRNKLLSLKSIVNPYTIVNNKAYIAIVEEIVSAKIKKSVSLTMNYDYFIFSKSQFSIFEIADVLSMFKVLDYKEDKNNYYLVISDEFLFASEKTLNINDDYALEYLKPIVNRTIRDYLKEKYHITIEVMTKIGFFYDENNRFSAVVDAHDSKNIHDDRFDSAYYRYSNLITKDLDLLLEHNQYDINSIKEYFYPKFSIDENGNFYVDDVLTKIDYTSSDLVVTMEDMLRCNRNIIKNNEKKLK